MLNCCIVAKSKAITLSRHAAWSFCESMFIYIKMLQSDFNNQEKCLHRCRRAWWWTTVTSSSETLSPVRVTLSSPATGNRKHFTSPSGRRWFSPVRRTLGWSTAWRARLSTPYPLLFTSTWAAGQLWPSGAELRSTGRWTGRCLSAAWRRPSAPPSARRPAKEGWRTAVWAERRGSVREGTFSLKRIKPVLHVLVYSQLFFPFVLCYSEEMITLWVSGRVSQSHSTDSLLSPDTFRD